MFRPGPRSRHSSRRVPAASDPRVSRRQRGRRSEQCRRRSNAAYETGSAAPVRPTILGADESGTRDRTDPANHGRFRTRAKPGSRAAGRDDQIQIARPLRTDRPKTSAPMIRRRSAGSANASRMSTVWTFFCRSVLCYPAHDANQRPTIGGCNPRAAGAGTERIRDSRDEGHRSRRALRRARIPARPPSGLNSGAAGTALPVVAAAWMCTTDRAAPGPARDALSMIAVRLTRNRRGEICPCAREIRRAHGPADVARPTPPGMLTEQVARHSRATRATTPQPGRPLPASFSAAASRAPASLFPAWFARSPV